MRRLIFCALLVVATACPGRTSPLASGVPRGESRPTGATCFPEAAPNPHGPGIAALRLDGVPVVVRSPDRVTQPPILLWHGFGAPNSEQALMQALPLDEVPAVKIYLGLPLFGQRLPPGGMNEVAQRQSTDYLLNLLAPVASGVSDDLRTVYEELRRRGCVQGHESIDAFGYSAGGFSILYATNAGAVPVRRLALLNAPASASTAASVFEHATGHPYEWSDTSREFARRLDPTMIAAGESAFSVRMPALLLLQGESDDAALREAAVALEALLHPVYRTAHRASQLQVRRLSGVGHGWLSKQDLPVVRAALADWYNRPG